MHEISSTNSAVTGSSSTVLDSAIARAVRRLAPYLMAMYVVSFLDRANVGFAKQALQTSVGISESTYALGAGLFFISYSLCGFPSNLILHKIGAKVWISFLMVGWGLASMATMFVTGSTSFYLLRLLLGVMEAGFFPGAILYLTYWFPNHVRGRITGLFYLGVPPGVDSGRPAFRVSAGDETAGRACRTGSGCFWWKGFWPWRWGLRPSGFWITSR